MHKPDVRQSRDLYPVLSEVGKHTPPGRRVLSWGDTP
jgi:hypothetical protein